MSIANEDYIFVYVNILHLQYFKLFDVYHSQCIWTVFAFLSKKLLSLAYNVAG